jgi:hypothetical protein
VAGKPQQTRKDNFIKPAPDAPFWHRKPDVKLLLTILIQPMGVQGVAERNPVPGWDRSEAKQQIFVDWG